MELRKNRAGHHNGGVSCLNQCLSRKSWACRWKKLITVTEAAFTLTKVRLCGCGPRQEYTLMVNILSQTTHYYYIIKRYIQKVHVPSHTTPAVWEQLLLVHPEWRHQPSAVSLPVQSTLERMALPVPCPKKDPVVALTAPPSPSCLHTTLASFRSQPSSQTVLQDPA